MLGRYTCVAAAGTLAMVLCAAQWVAAVPPKDSLINAQNFAMNDNSFSTTFGPSTPGAINLVAGSTFGATSGTGGTHNLPATAGDIAGGSAISDGQPSGDVC